MPGESLPEAYVSFAGVLGDRLSAVHHAGATKAFQFLSARSRKEMLRFRPKFAEIRRPELTRVPGNLIDAETRGPGLTPLFPCSEDLALEIEAPNGKTLSASDATLLGLIGDDQLNASDIHIQVFGSQSLVGSDHALAPRSRSLKLPT